MDAMRKHKLQEPFDYSYTLRRVSWSEVLIMARCKRGLMRRDEDCPLRLTGTTQIVPQHKPITSCRRLFGR